MSGKKWRYWGGGGVIVLLLWAGLSYDRGARLVPTVEKSTGVAMEIEGLKYSNYRDDQLQSRVQAGQLVVVPRQIGIFQVQSINEAVITRFRIEVMNSPEQKAEKPSISLPNELADGIKGLASIKGSGRITKVTIAGLEVLALQGDQPKFVLHAKTGTFDARQKQLQLEGITLQQPASGMRIKSERALWNKKINAFEIPGPYELHTAEGVQKGERLYVDMNFRLIFDKGSVKPKKT